MTMASAASAFISLGMHPENPARSCVAVGRFVAIFGGLLQQFGDDRGPAGLLTCAESATGVAVEVFEEQRLARPSRHRPVAKRHKPSRQLKCDMPEIHHPAGSGGAF